MTTSEAYIAPETLAEVTEIAAETGTIILAGGTDILPRCSKGLMLKPEKLVSLKAIKELQGVARANGEIRIGACTPLNHLAGDPIVQEAAPVLAEAAGRIACPQVRNRATIGGNLCNASPAADTAVPLILLDAVLELASSNGSGMAVRAVAITDFFRGPGATVLEPGEILTHIRFKPLFEAESPRGLTLDASRKGEHPVAPLGIYAAWDKFGTRPAMEIAVASVGLALKLDSGTVIDARVGYGSVAPTPLRGRRAESELVGKDLSDETIGKCTAAAREEISPITDVRAGAEYRRKVVEVMLRRMLQDARCGSGRNV